MSLKQNLVNEDKEVFEREFVSRLDTIMEKLSGLDDNTIQISQIELQKNENETKRKERNYRVSKI